MALSPGTRLGPYEVVAPLGAGAEEPLALDDPSLLELPSVTPLSA